jgi:sarcosine oxidase subunit beta
LGVAWDYGIAAWSDSTGANLQESLTCAGVVGHAEDVRCVVVGAGIIGLAVARELRLRGVDVVVLEHASVGAGASGVQPGGVRHQWGTRVACRLAMESARFWREADGHLSARVPLTLRRGGYLFAEHSTETLERLGANVRLQNEEGVPSQLVSPAEAAELVPGLRVDELAGAAWCAEDGYFDRPQSVLEAFASGIGVQRVDVRTIRPTRGGWHVENLEADAVVVAAGTETRTLLEPHGIDLPLLAKDRYLFLSDPIRDRLLEPLVVAPELAFAAKQLADGRVLASDLAREATRSREGLAGGRRSARRPSSCCRAWSTCPTRCSCPASMTSRPITSRFSARWRTRSSSLAGSAGMGS